jgi:hypothetical protein
MDEADLSLRQICKTQSLDGAKVSAHVDTLCCSSRARADAPLLVCLKLRVGAF